MSRLSFGTRPEKAELPDGGKEHFLIYKGEEIAPLNEIPYHVGQFGDRFTLYASDAFLQAYLPELTVGELLHKLHNATFDCEYVVEERLTTVGEYCQVFFNTENHAEDSACFSSDVQFDQMNWNKPWSPSAVGEALDELLNDNVSIRVVEDVLNEVSYGLRFEFALNDKNRLVVEEFERSKKLARQFVDEAEALLAARLNENSLVSHFNFPLEIRSSCEQYLLYFAEFLKDVGVDVTAEIKHEAGDAGQVLFSVTPEGGKEALHKVREALNLYLDLGQLPNVKHDFSAPDDVQGLQFQIRHFQNQLEWAEAKIEKKNAAIELKDELIAQLKLGRVFEAAQQAGSKTDEERTVSLFRGVVRLKRYDAKFCDIDLPVLYDIVREWLADENSTGNLVTYLKLNGVEIPEDPRPALPPASD